MEELIRKLQLQIQILSLQIQVVLLRKKLTIPNLPKPQYIVIHHGAGVWDFDQVNWNHTQKWGFISSLGFGIGYHYFISYDGTIHQGRVDNERAAHTVEASRPNFWNTNSIGICLQGNTEETMPTEAQLKSLEELLNKKRTEYQIPKVSILGHRNISPTLCPGKHLYNWLLLFKGRK